jgi:hypothetical protein
MMTAIRSRHKHASACWHEKAPVMRQTRSFRMRRSESWSAATALIKRILQQDSPSNAPLCCRWRLLFPALSGARESRTSGSLGGNSVLLQPAVSERLAQESQRIPGTGRDSPNAGPFSVATGPLRLPSSDAPISGKIDFLTLAIRRSRTDLGGRFS